MSDMKTILPPEAALPESSQEASASAPEPEEKARARRGWWLLALAVLAPLLLAWYLNRLTSTDNHPAKVGPTPSSASPAQQATLAQQSAAAKAGQIAQPPAPTGPEVETAATLAAGLKDLEAYLHEPHSKNDIATALERFRTRLMHAPRGVAVADIMGYMGSGQDVPTTLPFTIGPGGWLASASSMRIFLLDALGEVDPESAAQYAKVILDQPGASPDEWALSMRNLAQRDPDMANDPYLQEKARELVTNAQWLSQPTAGLMEAFDFVVFTKQTNLTPVLTGYMDDGNQSSAVRFGSFLTLDRLTLSEPAAVFAQLNDQPDLLSAEPSMRAAMFARADVTDPAQLAAVETYLQRPDLTPAELNQFAITFPLFTQAISNNLATTQQMLNIQQMAERDAATLAVVNQWLGEPQFAGRQDVLQVLKASLTEDVQSAQRGGLLPAANGGSP